MKEKDLWNFFLLTGNIDSYLTYRLVREMNSVEFSKDEEEALNDTKGEGNSNKKS